VGFAHLKSELDSCGIGFVADVRARPSREIVDSALEALRRMRHRGAVAADRLTGDGAGLLLPLPSVLAPRPWCGLAMVFLRDERGRAAIEAACEAEGISAAGWREVPVDEGSLGDVARSSRPRIEQLVLEHPLGMTSEEAELRAFRARKRAERVAGAYVVSLSFRTVTYKALCAADQLSAFYPDLTDPALRVPFAIFHQRFSTNTAPSWERAQPFRMLCHNGEINTLGGNVAWMRAREARLGDELLAPVLDESGSDSAMLDNALELLVRGGRDVRHAVTMLVPPAWQHDHELEPEVRAFHSYHAGLLEPWDGPAGIVFTDGRVVGAALDRNGLRPLRYAVTDDGLVACASEAGAVPLPDGARVRRGRLGPGQLIAVDPAGAGVEEDRVVKRRLARRRPYLRWLALGRRSHDRGVPVLPPREDLRRRQVVSGYTREEISLVLRPMAARGAEAVSSMGDDTALPPLSERTRPLYGFFRQRFAQVTNPAIDHVRERGVMSLRTLLGARGVLTDDDAAAARLVELDSFLLYPSALPALRPFVLDATLHADESLAAACARIAGGAVRAVDDGRELLLLSDEAIAEGRPPIPSLLAVAAVHDELVAVGLRTKASLLVQSDEPRETHHFACLLGFGADAICPRLALETVAELAAADKVGGDHPPPDVAQERFCAAIEDGVLKVMSKMGISDLDSYRGAKLFDAIGLGHDVLDAFFPATAAHPGAVGLEELEQDVRSRVAAARVDAPELLNPGFVKHRKGGDAHASNPDVVRAVQAAVAEGSWEAYARFAALVNEREPLELRDLLELRSADRPLPLDEVEPVESIVRRFSSGGMSHGSLSAEAHETVAAAFNRVGARSNSGEGGEDPARFRTERNSRIKQIASARFGVTPEYAVFADELQIKIAQGSKPGEGGQLPGHKVTEEIARLRHTQPGIGLISPPPHHDIYSIEDLAQLVFDLRQVNPSVAVSVKLVAEAGVGMVAAGVVKALADVVHIAGADGGTGASPLSSIKNAGAPWELGLVETQRTLVEQGLRNRVRLRVDGGLKTGRDVVVAALLGADEVSFGTVLLLAQGCLMVRSCHLDTCPVGIATQRPELRAKFSATPQDVETYLRFVAEEVRMHLATLGLRTLDEAVGRADLLAARGVGRADLAPLLRAAGGGHAGEPQLEAPGGELGKRLAADAASILEETRLLDLRYPITTSDRAVGARLGGEIAKRFGASGPPGRVRAGFVGSAGQSFGAFLTTGIRIALDGEANDYVGKSMSGGRIVIRPPAGDAGDPVLIGNTALYGATGGELFCAGRAGERLAVRNSGAVAVVEGAGDHVCEYMTGGIVVVLGAVGRNAGAGMSGGELYVLDEAAVLERRVSFGAEVRAVGSTECERVRALVEVHATSTRSNRAADLLARWDHAASYLRRVVPREEALEAERAADEQAT
jgi:glutamate synthase domain-containing protein 2/glutamate synthase domain-containing protein 1/glutamate synthase domain-containing protein 3